jgi:hypothetical protein
MRHAEFYPYFIAAWLKTSHFPFDQSCVESGIPLLPQDATCGFDGAKSFTARKSHFITGL